VKAIIYPRLLRAFDAALYVGQRSRSYYTHYEYPADRLFFSPHCVDTAWFGSRATEAERQRLRSALGIAPQTLIVLFAGRLVAFKRPVDVVAAVGKCHIKAEVMVAGSGELEADIKSAAASCEVRLHLLGFRNQSEMPSAYAAADCVVLPSDGRETWGLVANEALACGRPVVISSSCGCAPDLAADGQVGRIFPEGDLTALADAIRALVVTPPSAAAIAAVSEAYSLDAAVAGIRSAAERVATRAG
jgi:glycosyltransferase involved in cell wall biosynthesis